MQIIYPQGSTHIEGFRNLFILLNTDAAAGDLRRLIFEYFKAFSDLHAHLRESIVHPVLLDEALYRSTIALPVAQVIRTTRLLRFRTISGVVSQYACHDVEIASLLLTLSVRPRSARQTC